MSQQRILVVDDDQPWVNNIKKRLSSHYTIDNAKDVKEANDLLEDDDYALVIANSRYTDTLEIIQKRFPAKRLIVATSKPTPQEAIKMYDFGALDYFAKEFNEDVTIRTQRAIKIPILSGI